MISPIRRQHVHRRDRPAVVVQPHVEGLDGLRVIHHDDRLLRVFFGQIALVLRLQVDAPLDRKLELLVGPLEHSYRLAVIHMHEFRADDALEFRDQPLLDALVEEGEGSRERDRVAHVGEAGDVGEDALEVEAEVCLQSRSRYANMTV